MDEWLHWIVVPVFVVAGTAKGVSGMGLPTVSMALLGALIPPAQAAALMVLPSLATNIVQCHGPHWRALMRRLWPLWTAMAAFTLFSPLPDLGSSGPAARVVLGAVLIVYGIWGLARPALSRSLRHEKRVGAVAGALTGVVSAATGVFVMPLVPYLQALRLAKDEMIQALGLTFTLATLALALRLGTIGGAAWSGVTATVLALAAAFAGVWLGSRLRGRLSALAFQRVLFGSFVVLGTVALARAL